MLKKLKTIFDPMKIILTSLAAFCIVIIIMSLILKEHMTIIIVSVSFMLTVISVTFFLTRRSGSDKKLLQEKENEIKRLKEEKQEVVSTAFNVHDIKKTLELAVLEARTSVYRIMDEKSESKSRIVRYFGALKLEITAKYGINFKNIICSVSEDRVIYLENIEPGFLSFSERTATWVLSECAEVKKGLMNLLPGKVPFKEDAKVLAEKKEEFRNRVEKEIEKKGPMELDFLSEELKKNTLKSMKLLLGHYGYEFKIGVPEKGKKMPLEALLEIEREIK